MVYVFVLCINIVGLGQTVVKTSVVIVVYSAGLWAAVGPCGLRVTDSVTMVSIHVAEGTVTVQPAMVATVLEGKQLLTWTGFSTTV